MISLLASVEESLIKDEPSTGTTQLPAQREGGWDIFATRSVPVRSAELVGRAQ